MEQERWLTFEYDRMDAEYDKAVKLYEQAQIVIHLDALREETHRLVGVYGRKLAALEALKKSLLHRAFSGELSAAL